MRVRNKIPSSEKEWLEEISKAYWDAFDTIPFGKFTGQKINPEDLFHLKTNKSAEQARSIAARFYRADVLGRRMRKFYG